MSFYLACEASIFSLHLRCRRNDAAAYFESCSPEAHRPIMAVNGTADDVTYFNGDLENRDGWGVYLDMPTIVDPGVDLDSSTRRKRVTFLI